MRSTPPRSKRDSSLSSTNSGVVPSDPNNVMEIAESVPADFTSPVYTVISYCTSARQRTIRLQFTQKNLPKLHVKTGSHFLIKCYAAFSTVCGKWCCRCSHPGRWLIVYARFPLVTFSWLPTGYLFSRTSHCLHIFPRFALVTYFPALFVGCIFSRASHRLHPSIASQWLHLSPRFPLVTCFPAFATDYMFSRSCCRL